VAGPVMIVKAQQPQGQPAAQPQAPTGPMAPEKYKNIQVLTDVPADQLDLTMRYISAAVGMQCTNCHVRDQATGEFSYEKDDLRPKQTARNMIKMVKAINAGGFGVTANCATCHNGKNRPPGLQMAAMMTAEEMAAMAARAAGPGAGTPAGPPAGRGQAQQPPAPAAEDVINKYMTAMGGQAALDKLQTRVMSGTLTMRTGQTPPFTIEEKGNKYRETIGVAANTLTRGFDGSTGWVQSGATIVDLSGYVLQQVTRTADLKLAAQIRERYSNLQAARPTKLAGTQIDVNVLTGTVAPGVTERLSFDLNSGLLLRRVISTRTPMGTLTEQIDYADYRVVAGVKMPFEIKRTNWNTLDTLKVVDVKPNAQIDDARFSRPKG
jgi:photosynthetic reaction center cytochrome c subunit